MERQKDMRNFHGSLKWEFIIIAIIIIFHLVGLIGLLTPSVKQQFLHLVPYHLLLMMCIIIFTHYNINRQLILLVMSIFVLGYVAEWVGVNKHFFFGNYQYGQTLGLQLNHVPLIIGVNWFLLIYSAGVLMQHSQIKSMFWRVLAGAFLLVFLDVLIEPVAVRLDYWYWVGGIIPLNNYICWFFLSVLMLLLFEQSHFKKQGIAGPLLLITQFVFFAVLYFR